jgi:molybdopterin-guanine dinucleotide biosynthesis protein A
MTALPAATGIVLAGGRSRRFGRDKLAEHVGERPLLHLAIEGLAGVTSEVIVVGAPGAMPDLPAGVRLVHDEAPFEGPLAGCMAGLTAAREPLVLIVGGDMPRLRPAVLGMLLRSLEASAADACTLEHRGRRQPLPMALRTGTGTALVTRLLGEHERRLGAVLDRLIVRALSEEEWRPLDPDALTLRDVDVPEDLLALDDG